MCSETWLKVVKLQGCGSRAGHDGPTADSLERHGESPPFHTSPSVKEPRTAQDIPRVMLCRTERAAA